MKYDVVFFDLDGTLTQSEDGIFASVQYAVEQMGLPIPDRQALLPFIGPPLYYSLRTFLGMDDAQAEEALVHYRRRYDAVGWCENRVYPGIPRLLRSLQKSGVRMAVITGKPQAFSQRICEHFGLMPYLSAVIGPGPQDKEASKAKLLSEGMRLLPGRAVMVGDRHFDVEGAKACGIPAIGVTYGYGSAAELTGAGAGMLAEDVRALQELLLPEGEVAEGVFLSMEGMDGCGKTTQRKALVSFLEERGWEVQVTREPGGDEIAEKIRQLVLDPANTAMSDVTEAYLYAASRAQNVRAMITPALADGKMVVCDRFVDSSAAYQGGGRELGVERVLALNAYAVGGRMPDLTVYLQMPVDVAIARRLGAGDPDRLEREQEAFFVRTARAYEQLFAQEPRVLRVDASGSVEQVTERMRTGVAQRLDALASR